MDQKPSIGRIVHFVGASPGESPIHYAAIITEVGEDGIVGLGLFARYGVKIKTLENGGVAYDEDAAPETWHWPERV